MAKMNESIIQNGRIQNATKLEVITIGLGRVADLKMAEGLIWRNDDGDVVVKTKEAPNGQVYDQDRTLIVRVMGGIVLIDGMYDMYCPAESKIGKMLSNPIELATLTEAQLKDLKLILDCASEVKPSLAPADPGRKVIVITQEMVGPKGFITCIDSWNEKSGKETKLYPGDIFLIESIETAKGYRIGQQEFMLTHVIV